MNVATATSLAVERSKSTFNGRSNNNNHIHTTTNCNNSNNNNSNKYLSSTSNQLNRSMNDDQQHVYANENAPLFECKRHPGPNDFKLKPSTINSSHCSSNSLCRADPTVLKFIASFFQSLVVLFDLFDLFDLFCIKRNATNVKWSFLMTK